MADIKKYRIIKRYFPGSNAVWLLLVKNRLVIWRADVGHCGNGNPAYELLAYRISELLQLGVVPRTWCGMVDGKPGILQEFVDGIDGYAWDDISRHTIYQTEDYCRILILDYVIGNRDRYPWHCIHVPGDGVGRLWSVDHTNIFHYNSSDGIRLRAGLGCSGGAAVIEAAAVRARKVEATSALIFEEIRELAGKATAHEFVHRFSALSAVQIQGLLL